MALLADSRATVWGVNQNGVLGLGSKADMNVRTPAVIPGVFCHQVTCCHSNIVISNAQTCPSCTRQTHSLSRVCLLRHQTVGPVDLA